MAEAGMQPESEDPQLLGADPKHVDATLHWIGSSVSITLPTIGTDNTAASGASWNGGGLTENASTQRWDSSTSNEGDNALVATYAGTRYSKTTIKRGDTSASLTKS